MPVRCSARRRRFIDLALRTPSVAAMFGRLRNWRRRRLDRLPFPATWLRILRERVPYYRLLSGDEQTQLQKLVREVGDVIYKTMEGVAGGSDGPDDFFQRTHGLVGGLGDFLRVRVHLRGMVFVRAKLSAQQRNARQK